MGSFFNDLVTTGTGGVYSPDSGFSAPGVGLYTNTSYGQSLTGAGSTGNEGLADMIPGIGDARAQERANDLNIRLARENRDFQEHMSNTAYQRAMNDMRLAGLNPMLAYQQGGASVPSTSSATVEAASKTGLVGKALEAYTGISSVQTAKQQANTSQAQAESSIALQSSQAAQNVATVEKTRAETAKTIDSIKSQKVKRELERAQIPLEKVKESAASLAHKGTERIEKVVDTALRSTARPRVNKDLSYNNPLIPDFVENFNRSQKQGMKK